MRAAIESVTVEHARRAAAAAMEAVTASEVKAVLEEHFPGLPGAPESH